mgnify:CR=1 FL=1
MTVTLLAHHIKWDTDGDDTIALGLPRKMEVQVDLRDQIGWTCINKQVCDQLSDATGWLVEDFQLEGYPPEAN